METSLANITGRAKPPPTPRLEVSETVILSDINPRSLKILPLSDSMASSPEEPKCKFDILYVSRQVPDSWAPPPPRNLRSHFLRH